MSSIPDWQQICEAEYFNWCCTICNALAKSPLHLEDQFLVLHGVYTDINDDKWVKCTKCFPLIMCLVSKKTLTCSKSTSVHSWPVTNRTVSVFFLLPKLSKCLSVIFVSVIIISFLCFSMGHKGSNHPKKAKPEMSERA